MVDGSASGRLGVPEIEGRDPMVAEEDLQGGRVGGRPQGDGVAAEGLADVIGPVVQRDRPVALDPADQVAGGVVDRRQGLGEGAWAGPVAAGGRGEVQRLVGARQVVGIAEAVELPLAVGQVGEGAVAQRLGLQGAVEALLLALGLRVGRPAVADRDAQAQQPDRQDGVRLVAGVPQGAPLSINMRAGRP